MRMALPRRSGDTIETRAMKRMFGERAKQVPVSSTKSMTGHLLGGAGGLEGGISVLALRDQILPPTINQETPDPECDLDYVPNQKRRASSNMPCRIPSASAGPTLPWCSSTGRQTTEVCTIL